jgi:hypothetical protein
MSMVITGATTGSLPEALRPILAARGVTPEEVAGFQVGSVAGSGRVKVTVWAARKSEDDPAWQDLRRVEWFEQSGWF